MYANAKGPPPKKGRRVYRRSGGGSSRAGARNLDERGGVEAGSADQEAVYSSQPEELSRVARVDRAAVQEPQLPARRQELGELRRGGGGILRRRRPAGPDRPDRLVRDHERSIGRIVRERLGLPGERLRGPTGFPVLLRLSDAVDRHEPVLARPGELPREDRTVFPEQGAALRVADENVAAPRLRDHRGGHFPGERARAVLREVLGGERPSRARILRRLERGERRREDELAPRDSVADLRAELLRVGARLRARHVHLPVGDEEVHHSIVIPRREAPRNLSRGPSLSFRTLAFAALRRAPRCREAFRWRGTRARRRRPSRCA